MIVTCRPAWEGGRFNGSEADRQAILERALDLGAEYVELQPKAVVHGDVEYRKIEIHLGAVLAGRLLHAAEARLERVDRLDRPAARHSHRDRTSRSGTGTSTESPMAARPRAAMVGPVEQQLARPHERRT